MATLSRMVGNGTMAGRGGMITAELIPGMTTIGEEVGEDQVQGNKLLSITLSISICRYDHGRERNRPYDSRDRYHRR